MHTFYRPRPWSSGVVVPVPISVRSTSTSDDAFFAEGYQGSLEGFCCAVDIVLTVDG